MIARGIILRGDLVSSEEGTYNSNILHFREEEN